MYLYDHEAAVELSPSHGMVFTLDAGGGGNLANMCLSGDGRASRPAKACVSEKQSGLVRLHVPT